MFKKSVLFLILFVSFMACKSDKDEACIAPSIEKNIVNTWKANYIEDKEVTDSGEMIFLADGTVKDTKNIIMGDPVDSITWKVVDGKVEMAFKDASGEIEFTMGVKENSCNKIVLSLQPLFDIELTK
jgi:hypothetical protein